jgi:hypothetical protein
MAPSDDLLDRFRPCPGQWPDPFAAECGGPRRQKASIGGIQLQAGEELAATIRNTSRWNVMFIRRQPGELYLFSINHPGEPNVGGLVERVHPRTLDPIVGSPILPSGDHTWCGAAVVHANGDLYVVNGSHAHRLDPHSLAVTAQRQLPADTAHNGLVTLHDGRLVVKDLRLDGTPTTVTVLGEDLDVLDSIQLPESSLGRVGADPTHDRTAIYLPGERHLFRLWWTGSELVVDAAWTPTYRTGRSGGLAWDVCIAGGRVVLHDNGDIPAVRHLHATKPVGRDGWNLTGELPWTTTMAVTSVAVDDATDVVQFEPFPGQEGGFVIAPPTYEPGRDLLLVHDTANGSLAAHHTRPVPHQRWHRRVSMWMQPLLFPDTGELIINNADAGHDAIEIVDLDTGDTLARVDLPDTTPNGMFLTPGWDRDIYYCTFDHIAHIQPTTKEHPHAPSQR